MRVTWATAFDKLTARFLTIIYHVSIWLGNTVERVWIKLGDQTTVLNELVLLLSEQVSSVGLAKRSIGAVTGESLLHELIGLGRVEA